MCPCVQEADQIIVELRDELEKLKSKSNAAASGDDGDNDSKSAKNAAAAVDDDDADKSDSKNDASQKQKQQKNSVGKKTDQEDDEQTEEKSDEKLVPPPLPASPPLLPEKNVVLSDNDEKPPTPPPQATTTTTTTTTTGGAGQRPALRKPHSYVRGLATLAGTKQGGSVPELHSKTASQAALNAFHALSSDEQAQHYTALLAAAARAQAAAPLVARLAAAFGHAPHPSSSSSSAAAAASGASSSAAAAAVRYASATLRTTPAPPRAPLRRRSSSGVPLDELPTTTGGGGALDAPASATIENMREMLRHEALMRNAGLATLRAIPAQASQRVLSQNISHRGSRPGARRGGLRSKSFIVGLDDSSAERRSAIANPTRPPPRPGVQRVTLDAARAAAAQPDNNNSNNNNNNDNDDRRGGTPSVAVTAAAAAAAHANELELDWYLAGELDSSVGAMTSGHDDVWCGDAHGVVRAWPAAAADDIADALAQLEDDASPPAPPAPRHVWRACEKPIGALLVVGSKLWVGASDGSVAVWSRSGRLVASHTRHKSPVTALLGVPALKQVWSAAALQIMVWDIKSHKHTKTIEVRTTYVDLCFWFALLISIM
jgi:hypothetical protein